MSWLNARVVSTGCPGIEPPGAKLSTSTPNVGLGSTLACSRRPSVMLIVRAAVVRRGLAAAALCNACGRVRLAALCGWARTGDAHAANAAQSVQTTREFMLDPDNQGFVRCLLPETA